MEKVNLQILGMGVSSSKVFDSAYKVIREGISGGICRFDTAPSYGTENILGKILAKCSKELGLKREDLHIQTKVDAWQMQENNGDVKKHIIMSMNKMGVTYFDALLIHWPVPEYLDATWMHMVELKQEGLVREIGICNVRMRHLRKFEKWKLPPEIIQIERNPLRICMDEVKFCIDHGIKIQAYSPLCKMDTRIRDNEDLIKIASKYKKNVGQIVLRWHIDTGVMPIFTSSKPNRVKEYTDIYDFMLTADEIEKINEINEDYKIYLEACVCPGF